MRGDFCRRGGAHRTVLSLGFRVSRSDPNPRHGTPRPKTENRPKGDFAMCDFAADAEAAAQLMVGRTLTVERVRQLNAKDYFYQMLKDNPEMLKIYPGIENELLRSEERRVGKECR